MLDIKSQAFRKITLALTWPIVCLTIAYSLSACNSTSNKALGNKKSNLKNAEIYLEFSAKQPGIQSTVSGLQYKVLNKGSGCRPRPGTRVKVHYETKLAESTRAIDSSYARGKPDVFSLQQMIPAWKEGIPMMKEGATWEFIAHPKLAYGEKGSPPYVPPNVVTVYKVALLGVERCQ